MKYGSSASTSKFEATALLLNLHVLDPFQWQIMSNLGCFHLDEGNWVFCHPFPTIYWNLHPVKLRELCLLKLYSQFVCLKFSYASLWKSVGENNTWEQNHSTLPSCFLRLLQSGESLFPWGAEAYIYQRPGIGSLGQSKEPSNFHSNYLRVGTIWHCD